MLFGEEMRKSVKKTGRKKRTNEEKYKLKGKMYTKARKKRKKVREEYSNIVRGGGKYGFKANI
jgi:hypothetical protein